MYYIHQSNNIILSLIFFCTNMMKLVFLLLQKNLVLFVIHIAFRLVRCSITGAWIREVLLYKSISFVSKLPRIVYFSHTFTSFLYYFCILYLIAYILY